jgi:aryl-alcohol dehydrogenase-like predicted oxidoreductase
LEYRLLGRSGLKVSTFSFGAMTFGGSGMFSNIGDTQAADAKRQIDICLNAGVNLFDTANVYSKGESEEILAVALGARRPDVLIATKFYGRSSPGANDLGGSRHNIINACEASLRRLKTDYIDLYQIHNQDMLTPPEETLRALDDLVRAGKVRYVGSSNHAGWTKMRALATSDHLGLTRYISQQIKYSLLDRDAESELLPLGVHEGVGALIWGPLASGYLSGKFRQTGRSEEKGCPRPIGHNQSQPARLKAADLETPGDGSLLDPCRTAFRHPVIDGLGQLPLARVRNRWPYLWRP